MIYISLINWKKEAWSNFEDYIEQKKKTRGWKRLDVLNKEKIRQLETRIDHLERLNDCRMKENNDLRDQLSKAKYVQEGNKLRDTITGRYTKRPDPIVEESKKPIDYDAVKKAGK